MIHPRAVRAPMKADKRLILALDVTERERAMQVMDAVAPHVDAVKVNWPLVLAAGPAMITDLSKRLPVICDFKVADVPNTNRLITEQVFARGASGLVVHGFPGEDSLKACLDAAKGDVFVVAEMSHPGAARFNASIADEIARLAVKMGAAGIIAPATRPERVRALRQIVGDRLILSPGVGAQGGSAGEAIAAGADFAIVGRAIYGDKDPGVAAERLEREIGAAARARRPGRTA